MATTFDSTILAFGNHAAIEVPDSALEELGSGKRPSVLVKVGSYSYESAVGSMEGKALIPISVAHRKAGGLAAGDEIKVTLSVIEGHREVEIPSELLKALKSAKVLKAFEALSYSKRKEHARSVVDAKTDATREKRVTKVISSL